MCLTLEEADAMIDACRKAGVLLLYAEELFFAPKYVKAKQLADEGAFGRVHLVKQGEKRSEEHTSELQSRLHLVCRLLLEKKKKAQIPHDDLHDQPVVI